jgi:hypothetical protein
MFVHSTPTTKSYPLPTNIDKELPTIGTSDQEPQLLPEILTRNMIA